MMKQLVFNAGDMNKSHTINILDDSECEINPNEHFFIELVYVSGNIEVDVVSNRTTVEINDVNEAECGELL